MTLKSIQIEGYKTIRALTFVPGKLSVLIGPNGSGKSNLISFFRLLSYMLSGDLQSHVAESGGASKLLHDGPQTTRDISAHIELETSQGTNEYSFRLGWAAGDTLIFMEEKYRFSGHKFATAANWRSLDSGHRESRLETRDREGDLTAGTIRALLRKIIVHQFHNTSKTSRMRQKWRLGEGRWLKEDGANLAPFLYRLKTNEPVYYSRIIETIRTALPFFVDFELEPEYDNLILQWRERGTDLVFDASQASDGMLRFIAIVALLRQPERDMPRVIVLDEPELGLHPSAIQLVADLISSVSESVQVLVATQSVSLVDRLRPEDIVVVDRTGRQSTYVRLSEDTLHDWLQEYTLSELWEKNVLGGKPA